MCACYSSSFSCLYYLFQVKSSSRVGGLPQDEDQRRFGFMKEKFTEIGKWKPLRFSPLSRALGYCSCLGCPIPAQSDSFGSSQVTFL